MSDIRGGETEWYSECCTAPPLYDVQVDAYDDTLDVIGLCMNCRDHATFFIIKEEVFINDTNRRRKTDNDAKAT
tara:strand:+ start:74 stop:295 length:222 start_codon:yes stop_codon:yes gene_type:complete